MSILISEKDLPDEIGLAPSANPVRFVRCDVGRDDRAELGRHRPPAGIGQAAVLAVGVALIATRRRGKIGTARRRGLVSGGCSAGQGKQKNKGR